MKNKLVKRMIGLFVSLFIIAVANIASALDAPVLTVSSSGLNLSLSWTSVPGSFNYTLHFAPNPYSGEDTIQIIPLGNTTSLDITLWEGASYYVVITAGIGLSTSVYSNIGLFTLTASTDGDHSGQWQITSRDDATNCGESIVTRLYTYDIWLVNSTMYARRTLDGITFSGPVQGSTATISSTYPEDGGSTQATVTLSFNGNTVTGSSTWLWSSGAFSCSGSSVHDGFRIQ